MTKLAETLRSVVTLLSGARPFALVGGLAVSARTEPRFTRDVDFAIAVADDSDAERVIYDLRRHLTVVATVDGTVTGRMAMVRMRASDRSPFVDLIFASCGVETEITQSATPLDVLGVALPVATTGHLIAMKLVSRDSKLRPRDDQDLVELAKMADENEWQRAALAVDLIEKRGFSRGRDLRGSLATLRAQLVA